MRPRMTRKNKTAIIYLTGKPGVGKYTIARALAKKYGFIVCDNQLINNPVFELLQYDGYATIPEFAWDAIGKIRKEIFDFLTKIPAHSYVLTNNLYEYEGDRDLYEQVKHMAEVRGSLFIPVRLLVSEEEHLKRIVRLERRERLKSIDPQDVYNRTPLLTITHPHLFEIDVTAISPETAADEILSHAQKLEVRET